MLNQLTICLNQFKHQKDKSLIQDLQKNLKISIEEDTMTAKIN